jgi:hypothetical protein
VVIRSGFFYFSKTAAAVSYPYFNRTSPSTAFPGFNLSFRPPRQYSHINEDAAKLFFVRKANHRNDERSSTLRRNNHG